MEESLNRKARDLLATPSHEGAEILVKQLSLPQETNEFQTAEDLFNFCANNFPNCLTLMFLKLYRHSSNDVIRFHSLYLLSETLAVFRNCNIKLSRVALHEIKPLVIECLTMQETKESDMKFLGRVVSLITYNVVICDNGGWHELSDCILWLAENEPVKAFHVFIDLPSVYKSFINKFMKVIVEKAEKVLLNPVKSEVEDWSLALETVVKLGIQISYKDMRYVKMVENLLSILAKSVKELVEKGNEQFLVQGLEHLERFLSEDKYLCNYNKEQCHFVMAFMFRIKSFGTQSKEIIKKINWLVQTPGNRAGKHSSLKINPLVQTPGNQDHGEEFDRAWLDHLKTLSSLEVLKIFASTDLEDETREMAIRQLNVLLSDHTSKRVEIDFSVMRQLQPLLISCLRQEGITDSMFKVLGEVVSHVAFEIFKHQDVTWYALRNYITSSKIEFQRAVYIFQCLTMPLENEEFLIPVIEILLPEISRRLNPPTELMVDNSCWVLAFTGAFCAAIHLIEVSSHAESVKEIAHKMIESVRKLVERGMEVGLVRRAFRDVGSIVKKQLRWYDTSEYKLVKGLLWRLYAIKGMKWESKIVLWRINVIVERRVDEMVKELPENEFDWLNLTDEEVE
ncbi:unnamed protein product [Arabidopsis thaliana]|uniref:DUF577 domain-containing protein n=1 Tax=Arabidopsis thaliana TaxID=3702 RepID=Q9FG42_ARATH|nr:hypothetical protein (DUF577) [Arabidopsis thaliana]AED94190.1 hypothetical protein (DUF577) [Arabidopsis thaliana]BAB10967.1 unnamed protein product [Arabidopsis thaliana]|eukprot:NP_198562.1 hypothetical protein (DUF577) [Arabidopsis thaliana]